MSALAVQPVRPAVGQGAFPTVAEIRRLGWDPSQEESVYRRLRAPLSYLTRGERDVYREGTRLAVRATRQWIFEESEVRRAKSALATRRDGGVGCPGKPVREFADEYLRLLGESCVLQKWIADVLCRRDGGGRMAYVSSVSDAASRSERSQLLVAAVDAYTSVCWHEQRRFAYGSSLKQLVSCELSAYPPQLHQLVLTSTRGDFWSRYDRDLIDWAERPDRAAFRRIAAMYFNGDEGFMRRELHRHASLTRVEVRERRQAHVVQESSLQAARVKKGYARLGGLSGDGMHCTRRSADNMLTIDLLLWIDNVLEKVLDHKMLLCHELFLRLHAVRLALACLPTAMADGVPRAVRAGGCGDGYEALVGWFGPEAMCFSVPDSELAPWLVRVARQVSRADVGVAGEQLPLFAAAA